MILFEEFLGAMKLALSSADFQSGLQRRELTPDDVFCLSLTPGNFYECAEAGSRLMKVPAMSTRPTRTSTRSRSRG